MFLVVPCLNRFNRYVFKEKQLGFSTHSILEHPCRSRPLTTQVKGQTLSQTGWMCVCNRLYVSAVSSAKRIRVFYSFSWIVNINIIHLIQSVPHIWAVVTLFHFFFTWNKCLFLLPVYKAVCLSFSFSLFLSSLPPCLPAPGSVSSFTEQLKVTGTEREGEGGRDRGRTHHSIASGYTTAEEEQEMEGQREKRGETHKVLIGTSINR